MVNTLLPERFADVAALGLAYQATGVGTTNSLANAPWLAKVGGW